MKTPLAILNDTISLLSLLITLEIFALGSIFLYIEYSVLPPRVPLWYSRFFLVERLDTPANLLFIVVLTGLLILVNSLVVEKILPRTRALARSVSLFTLGITAAMMLALTRIIVISTPTTLVVPEYILTLLLAFTSAYIIGFATTPFIIKFAKKNNIMDHPEVRKNQHPAILHSIPTPRAGAVPIFISLIITGLIFLPFTKHFIGIYLGALVAVTTGVLDDKYDLSPYIRLPLQALSALIVVASGIGIASFTNPLGGVIPLDSVIIPLWNGHSIFLLADIFAFIWIIWVMNMINWSNGIDGQFPGIVSVAAIIIGLLSLRLLSDDPEQLRLAILSFVVAGAVIGTMPYNWHPAKMFYGFGNTMVGLILATAAILSGAKVAMSLLILIVPTLDAVTAIIRRIRNKKAPIWGDRKHLHHKLLDIGWSHQKIALFYTGTTALFGLLALYSSGKPHILTAIAIVGAIAFIIIMTRLRALLHTKEKSGA